MLHLVFYDYRINAKTGYKLLVYKLSKLDQNSDKSQVYNRCVV